MKKEILNRNLEGNSMVIGNTRRDKQVINNFDLDNNYQTAANPLRNHITCRYLKKINL